MNAPPYTLRLEREDGELLVIDGLAVVRAFLSGDPSAQPGGYDSRAGQGDAARITRADVTTMNQTMRARSGHRYWQAIYDDPQQWLAAIPTELDLIETDDGEWESAPGDGLVSHAIAHCIQPGIALAGATKVLHLKRPRLFPVLDSFVVQVLGINVSPDAGRDERIAVAQRLTKAIRREGRRNLAALRAIQGGIGKDGGLHLTLVRILDICLWFAHPAAGVPGTAREIYVGLR